MHVHDPLQELWLAKSLENVAIALLVLAAVKGIVHVVRVCDSVESESTGPQVRQPDVQEGSRALVEQVPGEIQHLQRVASVATRRQAIAISVGQ